MINALNTAATGMIAQSRQVEVISNNLANADTVSYKKGRVEFQDLLYQTVKAPGASTSATTQNSNGVQVGVGVQVAAVSRDEAQGSLRNTERNLDVAIGGTGFFAVQRPNGEVAFTRDGSFHLGSDGRIESSQGYPLLPEITVPPDLKTLNITTDGRVTGVNANNEEVELGQIQLSTFANPSGLESIGGNLHAASPGSGGAVPGTPGEVGFGVLHQRYLEASNVSPVTEMTDLIRAQRVYELNSKVIGSTDNMMSTLNQLK